MRLTLAIDTSATVGAALAKDGALLAADRLDDARAHAEELVPMINRLCAQAGVTLPELTDVAVGVGPGPFTGLRVGVVTALTLGALAKAPVRGVCSLDVVARTHVAAAQPTGDFIAVLDARRKELYWAQYTAAGLRIGDPQVAPPSELPDLPVVGPGAALYPEQLFRPEPAAFDLSVLACDPDSFSDAGTEPLYLRKPDATVATTRKSTLHPGTRLTLGRPQR